jgi:hypothetical protein
MTIVIVTLAVVASRSQVTRTEGSHLVVGNRWSVDVPLAPGREVIELTTGLENESDETIVLDRVVPVPVPNEGDASISYLLAPNFDRAASVYNTIPPVSDEIVNGRCIEADIVPVKDYVLRPGELVMIGMRVRAASEGRIVINDRRVEYHVGDQLYWQHVETGFTSTVRRKTPRHLLPAEKECRDVSLLSPGR